MIITPNVRVYMVTVALLCFIVLLTVLSFVLGSLVISQGADAGILEKLFKLFNVDFERNIPAWISSTLLSFVSFHFLLIAYYRYVLGKHYSFHWLLLGIIFIGLSIDEFVQFHEQTIRPLRTYFDTGGFLYYPWIVPATIMVGIAVLLYWGFVQDLVWETRVVFFLAGFLYVAGALGFEAIGGYYFDNFIRTQDVSYDFAYLLITHVEEMLELIGIVLFLHVGMRYVQLMSLSKADPGL
jgi:uncharacterized BrkB/YihY/UPF0761 family membrane protein